MATKSITSYGIVCIRKHQHKYGALLVEKRCTYAFATFIIGSYKLTDRDNVKKLFNEMTRIEKNLILNGRFDFIYYHLFMHYYEDIKQIEEILAYHRRKTKYEKFMNSRLGDVINGTTCREPVWEFPKGRKTESENDLSCAIREFEEETGINSNDYILLNNKQHIIKFRVGDCTYNYVLYIALYTGADKELMYHESSRFNHEISNVKWVNSNQIGNYLNTNLICAFKKIVKIVKKNKHLINNERPVIKNCRKSEIKISV